MTSKFKWRMQSEAAECGLVCVAACMEMLGSDADLVSMRQRFSVSSRGLTLREVSDIAAAQDLTTRAVKCEVQELAEVRLPAILHWKFNHFVVLTGVTRKGKYRLIDPALGEREVSAAELNEAFTGIALEVTAAPGFQPRKKKSALNLLSLVSLKNGVGLGILQALLLSLFLQAYVIGSPFLLQLAVDESAMKGDRELLMTLAIGFALFAVFNASAELLRGIALQRVSALMNWDMTSRLFHHMLRLPLAWFQRRRLADALTRFDSLDPVRLLFANGLVAALLDGVLSIGVLTAMLVYSPSLALIVIVSTLLVAVLKIGTVPKGIQLGAKVLQTSIAEKGKRIETLRAMQTIKLMCGEGDRERDWANKFAETVGASQNSAHFQIGVRSVQTAIDSLSWIVLVYVGIGSVIEASLSVGMFYAFVAYRQQFSARVSNLIDQLVAWRMLDLHSDRLADIALQSREDGIDAPAPLAQSGGGAIELDAVAFRYGQYEPFVLRDLSLQVEEGEFVAITGPSGSGKSTLLKVLTGLYPPTVGDVRFGGISAKALGPAGVRRRMGVVMQDDELLAGSILDNVSFFEEKADIERVWHCLELAAIADDVRKFPMRLQTIMGDMGSSLSGGQRQRLFLARALYRQPKILVLDEATSNLDLSRERAVHRHLRDLNVTRIVVSHRPETMRMADRTLILADRRLLIADASALSALMGEPPIAA
ncbi:peptidase domain-containing ABC transporter [Pseudomarimonas arenosa]|uniref:Peptidase domain-containing ABC transporter n=1 Tax=Pseudomarimonas arenosa TaxID=2774145 RepID=A0AAW3ZQN7_9GAMM|nr:peptidase domain-containing ABC transporter [Pseudomarimonas arenosa]